MQVKADRSEVIAPVLPPVIILPSYWSYWLFLETLNQVVPGSFPATAVLGLLPLPAVLGPLPLLLSTVDLRSLLALHRWLQGIKLG